MADVELDAGNRRSGEARIHFRIAVAAAMFSSVAAALYIVADVAPVPFIILFINFAPTLAVIAWLEQDARQRQVGDVFDFGFLAWIAWPIFVPWYAFKSRGIAGWRLLAGAVMLMLSPYLTAILVTLFQWEPEHVPSIAVSVLVVAVVTAGWLATRWGLFQAMSELWRRPKR